ncbi:hypothetical protein [Acinetobacter junii]|uniref:hypothetical protein n=1 Tax=Acinetobacter junii TaxID=40215 RepID=UPI0005B499BA|nr:hypothetical protein [Acinetobacter junii]
MSNLTEHKCAGKCPEFKGEQCHHCLITEVETTPVVALFVSDLSDVEKYHQRAINAQREVS